MPLPIPTVHPRLLDTIARFYTSTVTVLEVGEEGVDEWGEPQRTWEPRHVDIPARVVSNGPGTGAGGWSGEIYAPTGTYDVEGHTMSLAGFYPDITTAMQAQWRGETHTIQAVEYDAESVQTRLRTRRVPQGGEV